MNNKELYTKILNASNLIHEKTRKGYGNNLIVSPMFYNLYNDYIKLEERKEKIKKIKNKIK